MGPVGSVVAHALVSWAIATTIVAVVVALGSARAALRRPQRVDEARSACEGPRGIAPALEEVERGDVTFDRRTGARMVTVTHRVVGSVRGPTASPCSRRAATPPAP